MGFHIVRGGLGVGGESEKRATTSVIAHFCDALDGHPTFWVSHCVPPSPIPPSSKYVPAHIPLERGGAGAAVVRSTLPGALVVEPTSPRRGEGLVAEFTRVVGTELRCWGGGWW